MSLIYYLRVQGLTKEEREKFDRMLSDANKTILPGESPKPRPRVPSWWTDTDTITRDNLEAARQMGFVVGEVS